MYAHCFQVTDICATEDSNGLVRIVVLTVGKCYLLKVGVDPVQVKHAVRILEDLLADNAACHFDEQVRSTDLLYTQSTIAARNHSTVS